MKKTFFAIFLVGLAIFFSACSAELKITPNTDGTFSLEYNSSIGEKLNTALKDLFKASSQLSEKNASGEFDLTKLIDAKQIEQELNGTCFNSTQVKIQPNGNAYSFKMNTKTISAEKLPEKFLSQTKTADGKTRVTLTFGPEILQATLLQNKGVLQTFSDVFLAPPIIIGDPLSAQEYREMLTEIYGASVAGELLSGEVKISLVIPNGKTVSKTVPILELLTATARTFMFEY